MTTEVITDQAHERVRTALAPSGTLRVAINLGNVVLAQRDAAGGLQGVSVELARRLAGRLDLPLTFQVFDAAGKVFAALARDEWDLAFLAIDPQRSEEIAFTSPYVVIEGTYLVRKTASYRESADLDQAGVRVAVGKGSAYELHLSRTLRRAHVVAHESGAQAYRHFIDDGYETLAGVRQALARLAAENADMRVLDDSFMQINQALGVAKARAAVVPYLSRFVEEMKAGGVVAEALSQSGQAGARVAPPA